MLSGDPPGDICNCFSWPLLPECAFAFSVYNITEAGCIKFYGINNCPIQLTIIKTCVANSSKVGIVKRDHISKMWLLKFLAMTINKIFKIYRRRRITSDCCAYPNCLKRPCNTGRTISKTFWQSNSC